METFGVIARGFYSLIGVRRLTIETMIKSIQDSIFISGKITAVELSINLILAQFEERKIKLLNERVNLKKNEIVKNNHQICLTQKRIDYYCNYACNLNAFLDMRLKFVNNGIPKKFRGFE